MYNSINELKKQLLLGEDSTIILIESEKLSGIKPECLLIDDTELKLTISAARFPG
jgi:hypothetical protein